MKYLKYFENQMMNFAAKFDEQEVHKFFTGEYDTEWRAIAKIQHHEQLDGDDFYELIYQYICDRFGMLPDEEIVDIMASFEFEYINKNPGKDLYEDAVREFLRNNDLVSKIKSGIKKLNKRVLNKIKMNIDSEKFGI